jgi:hypothetical protein
MSPATRKTGVGTGNVKKQNRKKPVGTFKNCTYLIRNVPPDEAKTELEKLLVKDVKDGISTMEGLWWHNAESALTTKKGSEDSHQVLLCPYRTEAKCKYRLRLIHHSDGKQSVMLGTFSHSDHKECSTRKYRGGIPLQLRCAIFNSPGKLKTMTQKIAVDHLRKLNYTVGKEDERRIGCYVTTVKKKEATKHLEPGQPTLTLGAIYSTFEEYRPEIRRSKLGKNFDEHTVCTLSTPYLNQDKEVLYCVLSSENLLLNAWRQTFWGCSQKGPSAH